MRIIAGNFRGRRLLGPESMTTRPVTDRVKQSIFDIVAGLLEGANVYDVFAGTGSFGLEALSRGASHATFFERNRSAVDRLKRNVETLGVGQQTTVVTADVFAVEPAALGPADVIFFDPPYRFVDDEPERVSKLLVRLAGRLTPEGLIVFRHDAASRLDVPELVLDDQRDYGSMTVNLLVRRENP